MGDGSVSVAELAVIITLKAGVCVVVGDGESIDHGVGFLYLLSEKSVKTVLVDALSCDSTAETAYAASRKGEIPEV